MSLYGFKNNKCKQEVYPKSDVYNKSEITALLLNKQNNILIGTSIPDTSLGEDGDIYIQYFN